MFKMPAEVPEDQILVQQVGMSWQITQRSHVAETFDQLERAIERAVSIFRERRTAHLMIRPPDSPHMW